MSDTIFVTLIVACVKTPAKESVVPALNAKLSTISQFVGV